MFVQKKKRVTAGEEVNVAPEAADLLFEAEDVAELMAEVTGQEVEVTAEDTSVTFAVGDDQFTVEAEGDEEVLESVRKNFRGKRSVKASTRRPAPRATSKARTIKKVPNRR